MRFVLDHDVDVDVCIVLRRARHTCWRAPDTLGADGRDDEISVYADEKRAILITHDRPFTDRRKRHTFGQHVRLVCPHPEAVDLMARHLDALVEALKSGEGVYEIRRYGIEHYPSRWE